MKKITMGQFAMVSLSLLIALLFLFGCSKTQVKTSGLETIALTVKGMT